MKLSQTHWKSMVIPARIVLGLAFVFSGFVKAVDPWGTAYKLEEYGRVFDWQFLDGVSFTASVLLSAFEFYLGTTLLLALSRRSTSLILLLFMACATPLTLYIAIANPVTDCGCFGDAVVLSNTATFFKNLVLLLLAVLVYWRSDIQYRTFGRHTSPWARLWCIGFPLLIALYALLHQPMFDFRPYKIGNHLPDLMQVSGEEAKDSVQMEFVYSQNGKKQTFTLENAPLGDSTWTFVERKETVVKKAKLPEIHGFELMHSLRGDLTYDVLNDTSYVFLMISPKLESMQYSRILPLLNARKYAERFGYRFLAATSSNASVVDDWKYEFDEDMEIVNTDETTLKTIVRSNPGLLLLKNGTVVQKWGYRDVPDFGTLHQRLNAGNSGLNAKLSDVQRLGLVFLVFFIPLLLLWLTHKGYRWRLPIKM